jgi:phi LC3 family holin
MKINWKVRFKNKTWLLSFITLIVSFVYSVIDMLGITPTFLQESVMKVVNEFLMLLGLLGVVVDPTTEGIGDSKRALSYDEPWSDKPEDETE